MKEKVCIGMFLFVFTVSFVAYGEEIIVRTPQQTIDATKTMQTVQEKAGYLIAQAEAFYKSQKFQETITLLQYVLTSLDKNSQSAKNLLEKAQNALVPLVEKNADTVINAINEAVK